jgi:hypothetical protein
MGTSPTRIISIISNMMRCRICGLEQVSPPWGEDGKTPSFDICDCCGVVFGYEDSTPQSVRRYRQRWLARGAEWFVPKSMPAGWSVSAQLVEVPEAFRD